jgi:hypothetical protein
MRKVLPSIFAQDPAYTQHKRNGTSSETTPRDLGILSPKGEKGYLQRVAVRKNNLTIAPRRPKDEIPKALRSTPKRVG